MSICNKYTAKHHQISIVFQCYLGKNCVMIRIRLYRNQRCIGKDDLPFFLFDKLPDAVNMLLCHAVLSQFLQSEGDEHSKN